MLWLTRAHLQQYANSILDTGISPHCSRPLSEPRSSRAGEQLPLGAEPLADQPLLNKRAAEYEQVHTARPHIASASLITRTHSEKINFPVNKAPLVNVRFVSLGNLGLRKTNHPVLKLFCSRKAQSPLKRHPYILVHVDFQTHSPTMQKDNVLMGRRSPLSLILIKYLKFLNAKT